MAIMNANGTPFLTTPTLQQFNNSDAAIDLFNQWDAEIIEMGGSPIYYYEVFIPSGEIDPVYWEARGKIYSNIPTQLYCYYEPIASSNNINQYGFDPSPDEVVFEFNYKAVLNALGKPPKLQAMLYTPHLGERWLVVTRKLSEFKLWSAFRLQLTCTRFPDNDSSGEGKAIKPKSDYKVI